MTWRRANGDGELLNGGQWEERAGNSFFREVSKGLGALFPHIAVISVVISANTAISLLLVVLF